MFYQKYIAICRDTGQTPNGVAKRLGISSGTVSGWKRGCQPNLDTLNKICKFFDVSPAYFTDSDAGCDSQVAVKCSPSSSDNELLDLLTGLPPGDVAKVKAFIAGLKTGQQRKE